jgi:hypothetical protein
MSRLHVVDRRDPHDVPFATTTGFGVVEPVAGGLASAVDTFILSKWFPRESPRLFFAKRDACSQINPLFRNR